MITSKAHFKFIIAAAAAALLSGCSANVDAPSIDDAASKAAETMADASGAVGSATAGAKDKMAMAANAAKLTAVLAGQTDASKARYAYRRPAKTLAFFGIAPGMKVAEALPGGGWYSKILVPYLGDEGVLTGIDYSIEMWPEFGGFANAEFIAKKASWTTDWPMGTKEWSGDAATTVDAITFGARNTSQDGTYDAVLFIRALHNLSRFEAKGGYLSTAIADTHAMLKTGGVVGVVQHSGPETNSDEWAVGSNGYLKQSAVIAAFEAAGFTLAKASDLNANALDIPSESDGVWRLPPSLRGSEDKPEQMSAMKAIGESNRMTLKFVKQ